MITLEEAKQQALNDFDFDKAARIYELLEWEWVGVPGAVDLINTAERLISPLNMEDCHEVSSGGLTARLEEDEGGLRVTLQFVAVEGYSETLEETTCTELPTC